MKLQIDQIKKYLKNGQHQQALFQAKNLFNQNPENITAIRTLGFCQMLLSQDELSIQQYLKVKENSPNDFDAINNLGVLYFRVENFGEAISHNQKAKELNPKSYFPYINMGMCLMKMRQFLEARTEYEKALEINNYDINTNLYIQYMECLLANKDMVALKNFYLKCQQKYFDVDMFYFISDIKDITENISIKSIEEKLDSLNLIKNRNEQVKFHSGILFGLARIYEKKGEKKKAEEYFIEANEKISSIQRYNLLSEQKTITNIINNFTKIEKIELSNQMKGDGLIFITGMPRSGTTLTESIISSQENVFSGGEMNIFNQKLLEFYKNEKFDIDTINELSNDLEKKYKFLLGSHKFFIDKLPKNYLHIGYLLKIFPASKVIHIQRDEWDNATSLFKQRYIKNVPFSSSFFKIAVQMANKNYMVDFWKKKLLPEMSNRFKIINYEDLVCKEHERSQEIINFCGIDGSYDSEKRKGHFSNTASISQVTSGIHNKSVKNQQFLQYKEKFFDDLNNQSDYWASQKNV